ncbi:hypothetical protein GCM10009733_040120 [Nonomuraea maheshkhaliensis]|uniref:Nucleotide exchange factor GrpE n=1 Tax=Nonomuraea maheshkhaliensis TaxID=419590 RepID=A0ABN2FBB0_9ACTN
MSELQTIQEDLAGLLDLFRRRLLTDRENREATAALSEQLGWMRQSMEGAALRPLLYDLVLLADRIESVDEADTDFAKSLHAELLAVLEKYGVAPVARQDGPFDPEVQEVLSTVITEDGGRHGEVARIVRNGYLLGDRVLRPQQVQVYMCRP